MKAYILNLTLLFSFLSGMAQRACVISFQPLFGERKLLLSNTFYHLSTADSMQIETLKFYVSDITFSKRGVVVYKEEKAFIW